MMPMFVMAGSASTQATSPGARARSSACRDRGIHGWAHVSRTSRDAPVVAQRCERLVHGAVVAPVEDEDLGSSRDRPRETKREAVGVGRCERHLPIGQPKTTLKLLAHPKRVFGGQHERDASASAIDDGIDRRLRRVARHGARVAEAQVEIAVTVGALEVGAFAPCDEERERARPAHHPTHGHAREQRALAAFEERFRPRMRLDEPALLLDQKRAQTGAIGGCQVRPNTSQSALRSG
jgi:hypothetical protein